MSILQTGIAMDTFFQWYQSRDAVTATLKLPPAETRGEITATFGCNYCAIYEGGEIYWKCYLANHIVPSKCKFIVKKVRLEVRLFKAENINWSTVFVDPPNSGGEEGVEKMKRQKIEEKNDGRPDIEEVAKEVKKDDGNLLLADTSPVSSEIVGEPASSSSSACGHLTKEDGGDLDHLRHNFSDLGRFIKVQVQVAEIMNDGYTINFDEKVMEIIFQSSNEDPPSCPPQGCRVWRVELYDSIVPSDCSYKVLPRGIEIFLKKASNVRWKTLSSSPHSVASHEHSEPVTRDVAEMKEELTNSNPPMPGELPTAAADTNNALTESLSSGNAIRLVDTPISNKDTPLCRNATPTKCIVSTQNKTVPLSETATPTKNSTPVNAFTESNSLSECLTNSDHSLHNHHGDGDTLSSNVEAEVPIHAAPDSSELSVYDLSTGLVNIGNSCFMNSIIQCLSNVTLLRDFFLQGHYINDINMDNPLGFKGLLARQFAKVIRKLWSSNRDPFSPQKLKAVIAKRSPVFGSYQQQDSHEFMSYLLDGLHEDLNRVKEKPTTSPVQSDRLSKADDVTMADKAWEVYRKRNNSFFVDNFQGQFKSTLVCPVCQKVSVTFDPFMSLSVPLPSDLRCLPIFFVPCDPEVIPRKYTLELPYDANLELLKACVARKTNISMLQLRVFEAYDGKFQALLSNNQQPIKSISEHDIIIVSEVLSGHTDHTSPSGADAVVEINVIQRVKRPLRPSRCSFCGLVEKRLLRCGKCKSVGYCNKNCQASDWSEHRMKCREGRPVPVGLPFVVSLPSSEFTYHRLSAVAMKFAMRSVKVDVTKGSKNVSMVDDPMYYFTPVDRYGDNKDKTQPLEDQGNEILEFDGKYLAMDWQNNPKDAHCIEVSQKDVIDHELDPQAAATSGENKDKSSKKVTLSHCIELLTQPETLSKEEAWYCSKCKEHREATKQISLWRLPHILIIHLKRFSFSGLHRRDKINIKVHFPLESLDMSQFVLGEADSHTDDDATPIYDLCATVNHYGAIYIGHYTAQVRGIPADKKRDWLVYDDERVTTCQERRVVDQSAYILFYQRQRKPVLT